MTASGDERAERQDLSEEGVEGAWRLLGVVDEWVRYADVKASATLAGAGVLFGALAAAGASDHIVSAPPATGVFGIISLVLAVIAAGLAIWNLVPLLRFGEPASLIYFEHVARAYEKCTDHSKALREMMSDEDEYFEQLANQVWANSRVARNKFLLNGFAAGALGLAVLAGGAAVITSLF